MDAKHDSMHSAIQSRIALPSSLLRAALASVRRASRMATMRLPKQIDPKLVVMVRTKELVTADAQQPHSDGSNHHVATVPENDNW